MPIVQSAWEDRAALEGTVLHELRVDTTISRIVDILEHNAYQSPAYQSMPRRSPSRKSDALTILVGRSCIPALRLYVEADRRGRSHEGRR
jgi:hypothetical protein